MRVRLTVEQEQRRQELIEAGTHPFEAGEIARATNEPVPEGCPRCGAELEEAGGMVGETVLVCPEHGIVWEDSEDAVRRVI